MAIHIEKATKEQKVVLRHLMELYQYDFTEFDQEDVNEHGLYDYKYLDHYWADPARFPFFIKVNGYYAGFCLVRKIVEDDQNAAPFFSIAEFFIMKKYRKDGIGKQAAFYLFDLFPGKWEVAIIEANIPAQKFWRKVISEYTKDTYEEILKDNWKGPVHTFISKQ